MIKILQISLRRVSIDEENDEKAILRRELRFLQDLLTSFDESGKFWKKSIILEMFAIWCSNKSKNGDVTSSTEFISEQMSLFDVVYLDIVHNFR